MAQEQLVWIKRSQLKCLQLNKIREFHAESEQYQNLKRSLAINGFNPSMALFVRPYRDPATKTVVDGYYEICNGQHRFRGCEELGIDLIPCIVRDMTDEEMQIMQYQLNESVPTTLKEKHEYFKAFMLQNPFMTQAEVAKKHSITPTQLSQILRLSKLCETAKALVDQDKIKPTAALALVSIPAEYQEQFLEAALSMPIDKFLEHIKENRAKIKKAAAAGESTVKVDEFHPQLLSKDEIVLMHKRDAELLEVCDISNVEEYQKLSGQVLALARVLQIDPETIAYRKQVVEERKRKNDEERAAKKLKEASEILEKVKSRNVEQPAVTQGV